MWMMGGIKKTIYMFEKYLGFQKTRGDERRWRPLLAKNVVLGKINK
jgi:hypothetical protein